MMSIKTGKLLIRDQFKILPMPSTVIIRLNEMAAAEGRKILQRTTILYPAEGGLRKPNAVTYMRPTDKSLPMNTVYPAEVIEGYTVGTLADESGIGQSDNHTELDSYNAADIENDIRAMDNEYADQDAAHVYIPFHESDLDIGSLIDFREPIEETIAQPDASIPVTPQRSEHTSEQRDRLTGYDVTLRSPPLKRDLMQYYNLNEAAVLAKDYAMNITVKEALRSRGEEAERVILKELAQMRDKKV